MVESGDVKLKFSVLPGIKVVDIGNWNTSKLNRGAWN